MNMDNLKRIFLNKSVILEAVNEERRKIWKKAEEVSNLVGDIKEVFDNEAGTFKNFKSWEKMGGFFKEELNFFKREYYLSRELNRISEDLEKVVVNLRKRINELYERNKEANDECLKLMEYFKKQKTMFERR